MKKKYLIITLLAAIALTLTLSGCGRGEQNLDGKNVVTFELQGGTLETPTSSVGTKINFAYHPGTYILDPSVLNGYKIYKTGYNFTGWYTSEDCSSSSKWDFTTEFDVTNLTLYAGWEKAIKLTYTVYYIDGGNSVSLGSYNVKAGEQFEDWRKFAASRKGYTPVGYYSDAECTTPWDFTTVHPGSDTDLDVPVYVDYIDGEWTFVGSADALLSAIKSGENVYLTADVDFEGAVVDFGEYGGILNGNGFKIANFTVKSWGSMIVSCSIFKTLSDDAVIENVKFENVIYDITGVKENASRVKVAALAVKVDGAEIKTVSVTGTVKTNYTGTLPDLTAAYYEGLGAEATEAFTAEVTAEIVAAQ